MNPDGSHTVSLTIPQWMMDGVDAQLIVATLGVIASYIHMLFVVRGWYKSDASYTPGHTLPKPLYSGLWLLAPVLSPLVATCKAALAIGRGVCGAGNLLANLLRIDVDDTHKKKKEWDAGPVTHPATIHSKPDNIKSTNIGVDATQRNITVLLSDVSRLHIDTANQQQRIYTLESQIRELKKQAETNRLSEKLMVAKISTTITSLCADVDSLKKTTNELLDAPPPPMRSCKPEAKNLFGEPAKDYHGPVPKHVDCHAHCCD